MLSWISFLLLSITFVSAWIRKDPKIWVPLLCASLFLGSLAGNIQPLGLFFFMIWTILWLLYCKKTLFKPWIFLSIICMSFGFKWHFFPGYCPFHIGSKLHIGFGAPFIGLFPLLFAIPLARSYKEWKAVGKGVLAGMVGITILALAAVGAKAVGWEYKLPTFALARYSFNLFLTAIPEEAFYRGFLQTELSKYLNTVPLGKEIALVISSLIFTLAHIYWSPSWDILSFVFLSSLLYGAVFRLFGKLESAILTHFLLNVAHMTFFSYHAM